MRNLLIVILVLLFACLALPALSAETAHVSNANIIFIDLSTPGSWKIKMRNGLHVSINGLLVQAYESAYLPTQTIPFRNDLSPAGEFTVSMPAMDEVMRTVSWKKRANAKTFVLKLTLEGQERLLVFDLTRPYACKAAQIKPVGFPPAISISLGSPEQGTSTHCFLVQVNNTTDQSFHLRLTPWQRSPNGDKLNTVTYAKPFFPQTMRQRCFSFNLMESSTEIGLTYHVTGGGSGSITNCLNSGSLQMKRLQKPLRLKTKGEIKPMTIKKAP